MICRIPLISSVSNLRNCDADKAAVATQHTSLERSVPHKPPLPRMEARLHRTRGRIRSEFGRIQAQTSVVSSLLLDDEGPTLVVLAEQARVWPNSLKRWSKPTDFGKTLVDLAPSAGCRPTSVELDPKLSEFAQHRNRPEVFSLTPSSGLRTLMAETAYTGMHAEKFRNHMCVRGSLMGHASIKAPREALMRDAARGGPRHWAWNSRAAGKRALAACP